ncbi:MAG: MFS transporter [Alphaproteobacteria bacterium]
MASASEPGSETSAASPMSMGRLFGFGIGDFGFNLYWQGVSIYLLFYYTDVLELAPSTAGLIYAIASLWDGITDPLMGILAERTRSRWGRYRPYLLFGAVPLAVSYALIFYKPEVGAFWLAAYALTTHLLFRTLYTIANIPYSSLTARMTEDSMERNRMAAARTVAGTLGGMTVAFFTFPLVTGIGGGDQALGFMATAALAGGLATILILTCFASTDEPPAAAGAPQAASVLEFWRSLLKNTPFVLVVASILLIASSITMFGKVLLYFFKYNLGDEASSRLALTALAGMGVVMIPLWAVVTHYTSKRTVWLAGSTIAAAALLAFYLDPPQTVEGTLIMTVVIALGFTCFPLTFWSMLPDTVEYGQWRTGIRSESLIFGLVSFSQKAALALGAFVLGLLLEAVGFVANTKPSQDTLDGLIAIMTLIPAGGIVATMVLIAFYPLNAKRHREIVEAIADAGPPDAGPLG